MKRNLLFLLTMLLVFGVKIMAKNNYADLSKGSVFFWGGVLLRGRKSPVVKVTNSNGQEAVSLSLCSVLSVAQVEENLTGLKV